MITKMVGITLIITKSNPSKNALPWLAATPIRLASHAAEDQYNGDRHPTLK
jgi:hypothetical protein